MARVMACSNIMDSLFMVISAVGTTILLTLGVNIPDIFLVMAFFTVIAAYIVRKTVRAQLRKRGAL